MRKIVSILILVVGVCTSVFLPLVLLDQMAFHCYIRYIKRPGSLIYPLRDLERSYPGKTHREIRELLAETWSRTFRYSPYTQFIEKPFAGHYINIDSNGIRSNGTGFHSWPPDTALYNIFVFGGSTTFGCGVADSETIPAHLERWLGKKYAVYNLGCGHYFDTQERIRFEQLVYEGHIPDMAVFIDGINLFDRSTPKLPRFTREIADIFAGDGRAIPHFLIGHSFLLNIAYGIRQRINGQTDGNELTGPFNTPAALARYRTNINAIERTALAYKVLAFYVHQPAPLYMAEFKTNPFVQFDSTKQSPYREGYQAMRDSLGTASYALPARFMDLAGIQKDRSELLYVDKVHYTAAFCREIADSVARRIKLAPTGIQY